METNNTINLKVSTSVDSPVFKFRLWLALMIFKLGAVIASQKIKIKTEIVE